jgi:hypothetical protein
MTHLKIQQNNGAVEEVSSTVISKLYEIVQYVPDAALTDYRTAWSGTASKIFPIS